ncbi:hypothetical protein [Clostridium botulinum]|nr:hypothetical protein [Clostridium botulinum]
MNTRKLIISLAVFNVIFVKNLILKTIITIILVVMYFKYKNRKV